MNEHALRPLHIGSAALAIGGVLVLLMPEYSLSIVRLVIVTVAAATGLYALVVSVPTTWWTSPFDRTARQVGNGNGPEEFDSIRSTLSGPRQPIQNAPPLPGAAVRSLKPLIEAAIVREGLDPDDPAQLESAQGLLSPLSWAILSSEPLVGPRWFQTRLPNERKVAKVVHSVLDDLDGLASRGGAPQHHVDVSNQLSI